MPLAVPCTEYIPPLSLTLVYYNIHLVFTYFHRSEFKKGDQKRKTKKKGKRGVEPILERAIECRFRFGTCWLIQFAGAPGASRAAFYVTLYAYGVPMEWVCSLQSPTIWHDTPCHIMGFRLEPTFISVFQHRPKPPRDTTETLPRQPLTSTVNFIRCF